MSLTWATTHRYGANSLAQQFPSFQISAEDARSGNVKVESRSPSGISQDMSVVESNGIYTANFTPTEVGDWLISIMYDRQHIEGSPFHVRVYDAEQVKVHGLENGAAGKLFSFSVDTLRAGEGDLTVDVTNNGRQVPVQIHPEGRGAYRVTYTPSGGGVYTIRVYFSGMEVQGSPFTVEIIDASSVVASGDGLGLVEVNQRASFVINTGDNARTGGELKVNITSPRGTFVPCEVFNQGNGSFRVEYVVSEVGEYRIEVLYHGSAITGSPFRVHSSDWSRITVRNLRQTGLVGRMAEFDIDTSNAGSGNLEIMVNDGTIPCSVQNRGNRQFHASFMPKDIIPHVIQMRFNGRNVPNSPFTVDIRNLSNVTVTGPGLQLIPVNTVSYVDIRTGDRSIRDVSAIVTSPTGRPVSNHVIDNSNGSFRVEFTPMEVGTFNIEVFCEGSPVNGNPFSCKAFDSSAIVVGSMPSGMVGKPVEFKVDVTRAGEGQLEIMVNRGSVPNTVKMLQKGVFLVSFTPRDSQPHFINVKFNSEQLPCCPITVPILDTSRVTVQGEGLHQVAVNRQSYFHVSTQSAGEADLAVRVKGPSNCVVPVKLTGTASAGFEVEYTPTEAGVHRIEVEYANQLISGSPFMVKAYDVGSISVEKISDGVVGRRSSFFVNTDNAGEGNMEITIEASGRKLQNHVRQIGQGRFEVSFTPMDACEHQVAITFNSETIPGSPFVLGITDASKVSARGDGLSLVPCHRPSLFNINAPGARMRDLDVKVTGPRNQAVKVIVRETTTIDEFSVQWTPEEIGDHTIDISYVNMTIPGSPFTARAWDANQVVVSGMKPGRVGKANSFNIDASTAGAGNLEISVTANDLNIPNFVKQEQAARFSVSYTPQAVDTHMISIKFNGDVVPGSPFFCAVADGTRATLSGEGLHMIPVHHATSFRVDINDAGNADLDVKIIAPSGLQVPPLVGGDVDSGFVIDYSPNEVGRYTVNVLYAEVDVGGSPAHPEVFDSSLVRVGQIGDGILGQPVKFEVDTSEAGAGNLTVDVMGYTTNAQPEITPLGGAKFDVMFVPIESCVHTINITFNGITVPGAPFKSQIFDLGNLTVDWNSVRWVPVDKPASIELDARGVPRANLIARVTDQNNQSTPTVVSEKDGKYLVEFTPPAVRAYTIDLQYSGQTLPGCPFTSFAYDAALVKIVDLPSYGVINQEVAFVVDTEEGGQGDVDVEVTYNGQLIRTRRQKLDVHRHRYTFTPVTVADHSIEVTFNYDMVRDSPKVLRVTDPLKTINVSKGNSNHAVVEQPSVVVIDTDNLDLHLVQMKVEIKAPNGELVPAKIAHQPDEDYKVEYSSKFTGRHMVEILYAGQAIMGSPFYVEIYDPNKIRIEGGRTGSVGQPIEFEIIRSEAGKAELGVTITNPSGSNITYEITPTPKGDRVTYTPSIPGPYQIYITYGGLDVPGCPITQNVTEASVATAYGDGLYKAEEHKNTSFFVDTKGQPGDLFIQIDGPNSMAKYKVDQDTSGRYLVTYVPVEVGQYDVIIKWNGYEIEGSPFHPRVINPNTVIPIGGWEQLLSAQGKISLTANQTRRIDFDTSRAGDGQLTAEVRGPGGNVPVTVEGFGGQRSVTFTPQGEGEYYLTVMWNEVQLPRCPLVATTQGGGYYNSTNTMEQQYQQQQHQQQYQPPIVVDTLVKQQAQQVMMTSQVSSVNHEKVVLMGRGLTGAQVHEEAEFVIDGTDAGPGVPSVRLTGVTTDIDIQVTPVGVNKYRCTYVPIMPGAYLLSITWSDRQVRGSPFKVNICASSDASKVDCSGDGLMMGIMGREIKSTIDARQAGPGELTAHCTGPTKVAFCQLYDHHDGIFTLNIKPQEPGRHILQVKYGGEHVPGSPFELKVSGAPDASKVKVTGPGVEHGILATFRSHFICETRGAGAGQLTVRVRGPKGAFRVEMQRESQRDRTILCRYDPTEVGEYSVHVRWSDKDVPGSPFNVRIFDTKEELDRALATLRHRRPDTTNMTMASMTWHDDEM